jgi:hypothetical protein
MREIAFLTMGWLTMSKDKPSGTMRQSNARPTVVSITRVSVTGIGTIVEARLLNANLYASLQIDLTGSISTLCFRSIRKYHSFTLRVHTLTRHEVQT